MHDQIHTAQNAQGVYSKIISGGLSMCVDDEAAASWPVEETRILVE